MKKLGFGCMRLPLRDADVQKDVDMGQVCQIYFVFPAAAASKILLK